MANSRDAGRLALLGLLTVAAAGAAAAAEPLANPVLGDPVAEEAGRRIYRQRCYICHLSEGGRGPNLFATKLGDEQFLLTVVNGRKGTTMPAFGLQLPPDQVWQVHAYAKSAERYE